MPGRSSRPWFIAVLALGGILGGLLNPHFGLNSESVSGFGATLVSFVIGASLSWYIAKIFRRHHKYPTHTYLKALPLGLAVAAICVLISRATNFEPGYLYGIVVSIAFVETLEERHNAHLTVISTFSTLAVALLAWFAWVPINHLAGLHTGNIPLGILDDVLGSIFVGGLVGTVIGLMPLQFMPGGALLRWRKDVWAIVFFVALFLLVEVELNPDSGPTHHGGAPIVTAIVLFVGFGGATWMMRRYFIKRGATKKELSPVLATTTATIGPAVVLEPETDEDAEVHD
jgi:MFS family permease